MSLFKYNEIPSSFDMCSVSVFVKCAHSAYCPLLIFDVSLGFLPQSKGHLLHEVNAVIALAAVLLSV